jgi:hypothetical protein
MKDMLQIEMRSCELYPQVGIRGGDLNLLPFEKEMVIREDLFQLVEDHHLDFTQFDR